MNKNEPKKIACYRLLINDNDGTEVDKISLVEDPAIQVNFIAFNKDGSKKNEYQNQKFKIQDASKRMLTGVFMAANKPIYRVDKETGEEYYVIFEAQDIERAVKKFFKGNQSGRINIEHSDMAPGCYVMDSWFIRDPQNNPLKSFGFEVNTGDWCGTVYVEDEKLWNEYIKTGKLKGFSVEGLFKFGDKKLINTFNSDEDRLDFTADELKIIEDIARMLADEDGE